MGHRFYAEIKADITASNEKHKDTYLATRTPLKLGELRYFSEGVNSVYSTSDARRVIFVWLIEDNNHGGAYTYIFN